MILPWPSVVSRKLWPAALIYSTCLCHTVCVTESALSTVWCCAAEILTCGWWSVAWARRRQQQLLWWESLLRTSSLMRYSINCQGYLLCTLVSVRLWCKSFMLMFILWFFVLVDFQLLKIIMYLCIVAIADKVCNSEGGPERLYIHRGIQADACQTDHRRCW